MLGTFYLTSNWLGLKPISIWVNQSRCRCSARFLLIISKETDLQLHNLHICIRYVVIRRGNLAIEVSRFTHPTALSWRCIYADYQALKTIVRCELKHLSFPMQCVTGVVKSNRAESGGSSRQSGLAVLSHCPHRHHTMISTRTTIITRQSQRDASGVLFLTSPTPVAFFGWLVSCARSWWWCDSFLICYMRPHYSFSFTTLSILLISNMFIILVHIPL